MFRLLSLFQSRRTRPARERPSSAPARGKQEPRSEADWLRARSPARPSDLALTEATTAWLQRLPLGLRPTRLCAKFPGLANRLALCWNDAMLTERVFESLLLDRRGNRLGFPPPVANELMRLRAHRGGPARSDDAGPMKLWDKRHLATSDR